MWDILTISTLIFLVWWLVDSTLIHAPDCHQVASNIEKKSNCVHPLISISLELYKTGQVNSFVERSFSIAAKQITGLSPVSFKMPITLWPSLILIPVWILSINQLDPSMTQFWNVPFQSINSSGATVTPGTVKIARNDSITLKFHPNHFRLPSCKVVMNKLNEKSSDKIHLRADSSSLFSLTIDSVKQTFVYQFIYGGKPFKPETVIVVPPPSLYSLQVKLTPPSYIGDSVSVLPEGEGDFKVYAGTKVNFILESEELSRAFFITGNDSISMSVDGNRAKGEIIVQKSIDYCFGLVDSRNQRNDSLPRFHIDIISDELPLVHFLKPGFNTELKIEQVETLWVQGIDDIGIRSLELVSCRNGQCEDSKSVRDISPEGNPLNTIKQVIWNLNEYSLYPGDTLFYWAKIRDNRPFSPPGINNSDTFWFRVPGFEEIHRSIVEQENYAEEKIEGVREKQENLREMLENLVKSAGGSEQLSWDQKQIIEDVEKTIQAQSDSLQNALKSLEENVEKLKQQGSIGEEISEKMEQIQKELRDLIKQFGDSLMPDFKKDNPVSFDEMRDAIENLQKMLPELDERLDNTLQFLEMLRKDRELASMAMRAEKLAQEQKSIADQTQSLRTMEQQRNLLSRVEKFSNDLKKNHSSEKELSTISEQIDNLRDQMQSSLSNKQNASEEQMNQMSGSLLSASQQLRNMMSATKAKQMQAEQKMMMEMASDALNLSDWQELIIGDIDRKDRKKVAIKQQALNNALKKVAMKIDSLKSIPPMIKNNISKEFSNTLNRSDEAVQALKDNNVAWAMRENKTALNSLANTLIKTIKNVKQQCQGSSCGSGIMDALRNLSGKQASINAATADLLKSLMNGSNGNAQEQSGGQGQEYARKAAQQAQKALADELRKLAEKYGKEYGDPMAGRVEQLEKEAQRLAKMLEQPQPEISKHQDRFLSRMLQATLSMHRQDEGKEERKSKSAETVFTVDKSTNQKPVLDDPDTFYLLRRKALMGNFPESYREAVKAYFDSLEVLFLNK
ncbi:MAG TPA: hypothetical protein VHP36_04935 [Chitinispirillaceae bacterium]|nr:hypothetical protein [Chitinispirillaceae bacterium]